MSVVLCTSSLRSIVVSWHFVLLLLAVEQMMEGVRQDASLTNKERRFRLARIGKNKERAWQLFLEEVANVLEPQIQVSVLERIDEEIVEVTKQ